MKRTALAIVSLLLLAFAPAAFAQDEHEETPAAQGETQETTHVEGSGEEQAGEEDSHAAAEGDDAHAGEVHEKGELLPTIKQGLAAMITAFIVFGAVFFILKSKAWPVIAGGLDERNDKIRSEINAAEKARQDAKDALFEYEKSLNDARAESKKILDETKAYQLQLAGELKAKADVELASMKERARRDIEAAQKTAITQIYSEATALSTLMAGKILKRQVNEADSSRLLEESLAELPNVN